MKIDANNPIMRSYDGHGIIEKYPSNLTILGVMQHELGHINNAYINALSKGEEVVYKDIDIDIRFEGSKLIAVAGLAKTITAKKISSKNNNSNLTQNNITNSNISNFLNNNLTKNTEINVKLNNIYNTLLQHKQKLENKLNEFLKNENNTSHNSLEQIQNKDIKNQNNQLIINNLKNTIAKLNNLLNSLESLKTIDNMNNLFQKLIENLTFIEKILDIKNNLHYSFTNNSNNKKTNNFNIKDNLLNYIISNIESILSGTLINLNI